jgi:hypothetical protein
MKFETYHNHFFNSSTGAFSPVTERENYDSQITLTDVESDIIVEYFGKDHIHVGNVKKNPSKASKAFRLYNTGEVISLNLVFPKPNSSELRLYLSSKAGFKPKGGDIWFLFEDIHGMINIGYLDRQTWYNLGQFDDIDDSYSQDIIAISKLDLPLDNLPNSSQISKFESKERVLYRRDPKVALKRIILSEFTCEVDRKHTTFTSAKTNKQFMEAHHLIPMAFQNLFDKSLDNVENIISLCPNCHRAFHYSIPNERKRLISQIYDQRVYLHSLISKQDTFGLYNCYDI